MSKRFVVATLILLVLLAAAGFALGKRTVGDAPTLTVQTVEGKEVELNLRQEPILFVAYWCPHCEHFLLTAKEMGIERLPAVVSIWPREGDTFETVVQGTKEKLERTGWADTSFYVLMAGSPPYVQGTPTLAWWDEEKGKVETTNPLLLSEEELRALLAR